MSYKILLREKQILQDKLAKLNSEISNIQGLVFIQRAVAAVQEDFFATETFAEALALVTELTQRDNPMTYQEIANVFAASGYEYHTAHILACEPDSKETIEENAAWNKAD